MPKDWIRGPQGQLRPAHPGGAAVYALRVGLGEIEEQAEKPPLPPGPRLAPGEVPPETYGPGLPPPPR